MVGVPATAVLSAAMRATMMVDFMVKEGEREFSSDSLKRLLIELFECLDASKQRTLRPLFIQFPVAFFLFHLRPHQGHGLDTLSDARDARGARTFSCKLNRFMPALCKS